MFLCDKCDENFHNNDPFQSHDCEHTFCYDCARQFVLDWHTLRCPAFPNCQSKITFEQAETLLTIDELGDCLADLLATELNTRDDDSESDVTLDVAAGGLQNQRVIIFKLDHFFITSTGLFL